MGEVRIAMTYIGWKQSSNDAVYISEQPVVVSEARIPVNVEAMGMTASFNGTHVPC
jgi:hypothetical protein